MSKQRPIPAKPNKVTTENILSIPIKTLESHDSLNYYSVTKHLKINNYEALDEQKRRVGVGSKSLLDFCYKSWKDDKIKNIYRLENLPTDYFLSTLSVEYNNFPAYHTFKTCIDGEGGVCNEYFAVQYTVFVNHSENDFI